jgi:hypothetical protein
MKRVLLLIGLSIVAGCQAQNPFAAFGPSTVPTPTAAAALPYYPPAGQTAAAGKAIAPPASTPRISVSADQSSPLAAPRSAFIPDPADSQPVKIVENPSLPATRTAAGTRSPAPAAGGAFPSAAPTAAPRNASPPALDRQRGYLSPPTGNRAGAVVPASFESDAAAIRPASTGSGQWRAR